MLISNDGQTSWMTAGATAAPAVIGALVEPPGVGPASLEDRVNTLLISLSTPGAVLQNADPASMRAGGNLAMVGGELLQFANAEPVSAHLWRLSGLWRGRRGTEAAVGTQAAGDGFTLMSRETLAIRDLPMSLVGNTTAVLLEGIADAEPQAKVVPITGRSLAPPSPVHVTAMRDDDGSTRVAWVRRSRNGWDWVDGADAPLAEESERYRLTITPEGGATRVVETAAPWINIAPAERETALTLQIVQLGHHAPSLPATFCLNALGES